jgi:hypothetical protein
MSTPHLFVGPATKRGLPAKRLRHEFVGKQDRASLRG